MDNLINRLNNLNPLERWDYYYKEIQPIFERICDHEFMKGISREEYIITAIQKAAEIWECTPKEIRFYDYGNFISNKAYKDLFQESDKEYHLRNMAIERVDNAQLIFNDEKKKIEVEIKILELRQLPSQRDNFLKEQLEEAEEKIKSLDTENEAHQVVRESKLLLANYLKSKLKKIKKETLGYFCGIVNQSNLDKRNETESDTDYTGRICKRFGFNYTDKVRQHYNIDYNKRHWELVKQEILPNLDPKEAQIITDYMNQQTKLYA